MLVPTSDEGLAPYGNALAEAVRNAGNKDVTTAHAGTDHSWSDRRIELESLVIDWLEKLR